MGARHDNYARLRLPFLRAHRWCEIRLHGCAGTSGQVHHMVPRGRAAWLIDDPRNFAAVCGSCHERITRPAPSGDDDLAQQAWVLSPFRFPSYAPVEVDGLAGPPVEPLVLLAGVPAPEGLVTEAFAVALGPGWVDLEHSWRISFRNDDRRDARLANLVVGRAA